MLKAGEEKQSLPIEIYLLYLWINILYYTNSNIQGTNAILKKIGLYLNCTSLKFFKLIRPMAYVAECKFYHMLQCANCHVVKNKGKKYAWISHTGSEHMTGSPWHLATRKQPIQSKPRVYPNGQATPLKTLPWSATTQSITRIGAHELFICPWTSSRINLFRDAREGGRAGGRARGQAARRLHKRMS